VVATVTEALLLLVGTRGTILTALLTVRHQLTWQLKTFMIGSWPTTAHRNCSLICTI